MNLDAAVGIYHRHAGTLEAGCDGWLISLKPDWRHSFDLLLSTTSAEGFWKITFQKPKSIKTVGFIFRDDLGSYRCPINGIYRNWVNNPNMP